MRVIVLNINNIVQDGQNNKLVYNFPNSIDFKNKYISVQSVNMYYSWFNITAELGNNKFSYTWTVAALTTVYNIVIPDGLYQVNDLNNLLQFTMINNGHYLGSNGSNVNYVHIVLNTSRYGVQINTYLVPTALPVGYSSPSNFAGFPTIQQNPIVLLPGSTNASNNSATGISALLGFVANFTTNANINNTDVAPVGSTTVSKLSNGTFSYLSTLSPNLQPNSTIFFSMSNINNGYSIPSSIVFSLVPSGAVGTLISQTPPQLLWNRMIDGTYNQLRLAILGTDYNPIKINDPDITIVMVIKDADEDGRK